MESMLAQVFSAKFYMGLFGGSSPKRHVLWSNCKTFLQRVTEDKQYMPMAHQKALSAANPKPLVKKTIDKQGRRRHAGIRENLRASQILGEQAMSSISKFLPTIALIHS